MDYTYWLPDENNGRKSFTTQKNSVILIGANGSGKSKLGAWIEQQDGKTVHRIGAQRSLNFDDNITMRTLSAATDLLLYGDLNERAKENKTGYRWSGHQTTKLLQDYDYTLSALLATRNEENEKYVSACKEAQKKGITKPDVPVLTIERLIDIWKEILPHRDLVVQDSKFYAKGIDDEDKYLATEMSDGERAVLYLAAQVLCIPEQKTLIIDEPEIHLHRSIMNRLWKTLEHYRQDCLFIYITHDLDFAAAHGDVDKYWIREYDGKHWKYERIEPSDLPEELTLEILGSRKNVLFVEGTKNSYDYQLYSLLYPEYLIIPCGGCTQVIQNTKAFRSSSVLHDCSVYGLIDRDYRSEHEIDSYQTEGIYTLEVAEVENLFLVEELIRCIANHMAKDPDEVYNQIKDYVINTRFKNEKSHQVCESTVSEIKYRLSCIDVSKKSEAEAKSSLNQGLSSIDFDAIRAEKEQKFDAAETEGYKAVLKHFNRKDLSRTVGSYLDLHKDTYRETVLNLLRGGTCKKEIEAAFRLYIPNDIPHVNKEVGSEAKEG